LNLNQRRRPGPAMNNVEAIRDMLMRDIAANNANAANANNPVHQN